MVTRYDFEVEDAEAKIIERRDGDYVDYSDYAELEEEVARLKVVIAAAIDELRDA